MVGSGEVSELDQYSTDGVSAPKPGLSHSVLVQIQVLTGMYQHLTSPMAGVVWSCGGMVSISSCISLWRYPYHASTDLMLSNTCSGMT